MINGLPEKLEWEQCRCRGQRCVRQYPTNMGTFGTGTGFEPHEREAIDVAWALLAASQTTEPTESGISNYGAIDMGYEPVA